MNKNRFTKEKLTQYLLIVSIISISLVGLYFLQRLTSPVLVNIFNAIKAVLIPFLIAFFLSFIIGPLSIWIQRTFKLPKSLSIILAILLGIIFILGIMIVTIGFILSQLNGILSSLLTMIDNVAFEQIITNIIANITEYMNASGISDIITEITENGASIERLFAFVGSIFLVFVSIGSSIINIIVIFALTPVFMYHLVKEKSLIFDSLSKIAPKNIRHHVVELGKRSDVVIKNYFRGQGLMVVIVTLIFVFSLGTLSFFIPNFTIQHALIFGIIMGLVNIIPYVGAWIGISAPIIFLLAQHLQNQQSLSPSNVYLIAIIAVILINLIEQALESSIIQPNVLGKQVHIHPLAILSSFIFFGGVFGFAGFLLAVPIAGTIRAALHYMNEQNEMNDSSTEIPIPEEPATLAVPKKKRISIPKKKTPKA